MQRLYNAAKLSTEDEEQKSRTKKANRKKRCTRKEHVAVCVNPVDLGVAAGERATDNEGIISRL